MRENKYLYASARSLFKLIFWCLVATSVSLHAFAGDKEPYYDSSIQRSNFLPMEPKYQKGLYDQIDDRRSAFLWKLRFDGQGLQTDGNINSQWAGGTFVGKFKYKLMDDLKFVAKMNMAVRTGSTQDIFGDLEPNSGIYPRKVNIKYEPFEKILWIKAGLIQQRFFNQPLFLRGLPFMGLSQWIGKKGHRATLGLRLQQMIPTAYTASTRVADRETTPNFFTESLEGKLIPTKNTILFGRATHFRYTNLPPSVAWRSCIYGNTVTCTAPNNSRFEYEFEGYMWQGGLEQKFSNSLSAQFHYDVIINNQAPEENGEARSIWGSLANDFGRWIVAAKYKDFFIEADAVPALYNSYLLGHNNRIGNSYELNVESKDWGVIFKGQYIKADLLRPNGVTFNNVQQDNQQTIYFAVETMYDFI